MNKFYHKEKIKIENISDEVNNIITSIPIFEIQQIVKEKYGFRPTMRQVKFAKYDIITDNHSESYREVYSFIATVETQKANGYKISKNTHVILTKQIILNRVTDILTPIVFKAIEGLKYLVEQNRNLSAKLQACDSILDRSGITRDSKLKQNVAQPTISITEAQYERLIKAMEESRQVNE